MTTLADHQFEILPSFDAADGFAFGQGLDIAVDEAGFDPGENAWITQDGQNTRRGVTGFGRDVLGAKTWSWSSFVDQDTVEDAVATLEDFSAAWMPELLVRDPGAVTALRYKLAGRTRRVVGRPRRFAAPPTNLILNGYVPVDHDFQTHDSFTYDDEESTAQILYSSSSTGGGVVLPVVMPAVMMRSDSSGAGQVSVGGNARSYPVVRFNGPWVNPIFDTGDWILSWTGAIPPAGWVEIDCRTWNLTVLNQSGASVVEGLSRRTRFEDCSFAAGSQPQITLGGLALGGTASVDVRWRNTWTSI